jgi:hypothetical protein
MQNTEAARLERDLAAQQAKVTNVTDALARVGWSTLSAPS